MAPHRYTIRSSAGTRQSFEQIYDAHFDGIFRYILHRVGNVAEAEDLTSQSFFKALRALWRFRWSGVSVSSWLYRIATNEVNSHFRRHGPPRKLDSAAPPESLSPVEREALQAECVLAQNEIFTELCQALHRLKPDEQTLVVLRYLEEKPYSEIAEILGKPTGTVTMRTHRALTKLKTHLEERGVDHERFREGFERTARTRYPSRGVQADLAP